MGICGTSKELTPLPDESIENFLAYSDTYLCGADSPQGDSEP
jgi:hypothetical protein